MSTRNTKGSQIPIDELYIRTELVNWFFGLVVQRKYLLSDVFSYKR